MRRPEKSFTSFFQWIKQSGIFNFEEKKSFGVRRRLGGNVIKKKRFKLSVEEMKLGKKQGKKREKYHSGI